MSWFGQKMLPKCCYYQFQYQTSRDLTDLPGSSASKPHEATGERHRARELCHPVCQPKASEAIPYQLLAVQSYQESGHPTSQFGTKPQELPSRPQIPKARKWLLSQVSGWGCLLGRIVDSPCDDSLSGLKDFWNKAILVRSHWLGM